MMQKRTLAVVVAVVLVVAGVIAVAQLSVYTPEPPPVASNPANVRAARFGAGAVRSDIATAGYKDIRDMKFRHGQWSADAETRRGKTVSLRVDPANGKVLATRQG